MFWIGFPLLCYVGVVFVVYLLQDILVFPGTMRGGGHALPQIPRVTTDTLALADGTRFRTTQAEPEKPPKAVVLLFLGNGEDLASGMIKVGSLIDYRVAAIAIEYPGYGDSEGSPSVGSILEAAEVAAAYAQEMASRLSVPLFVMGTSLGSFPAVHVASTRSVAGLLLAAPPTSVAEAGAARYWFLPVNLLLRHRFENTEPARRVECPSLVIHGDRDGIVPTEMGKRLAEIMGGRFLLAEGWGHTWLLGPGGPFPKEVRAFLWQR